MQQRTLGTSGLRVSAIGLGCMTKAGGCSSMPDRKDVINLIHAAVDRGVPLFDTAEVYGPFCNEVVHRESAQNFNPLCAMAGRLTIAEVEHLVDPGDISAREIHTPGVFVQRVLHVPDSEKRIERHTTRPEPVLAAMEEVQT